MKSIGLPTSPEYFNNFLNKFIIPATTDQSTTAIYIGGVGHNSLLRHMISHSHNVKKLWDKNIPYPVILLVESLDRSVISSAWLRALEFLGIKLSANAKTWDSILKELTWDLGHKVIICATLEDNLVNSLLQEIVSVNTMMINLHFGIPYEVSDSDLKPVLKDLYLHGTQNVSYMQMYDPRSIDAIIKTQIDLGLSPKVVEKRNEIITLSGGYPILVRYLLRNFEKLSDADRFWSDNKKDPALNSVFNQVWDNLTESSQDWLWSFVNGKRTTKTPSEYLVNTGIVKGTKDSKNPVLFSPLFELYVKNVDRNRQINIKAIRGEITINEENARLILSDKQYEIFKILVEGKGNIVSREEIAKIMWGEAWHESYSDWAIDQIIKRIRSAIGDRGKEQIIKAVKGKGFLLRTSNK